MVMMEGITELEIVLVEFLDFGNDIHGEVGMVLVVLGLLAVVVVMSSHQAKGKRFCRVDHGLLR